MRRDASQGPLYSRHEQAFSTQYAELSERTRSEDILLPGTPGQLVLRTGTGHPHWYRRYYAVPGQQAEDWVGKDGDVPVLEAMQARIEFAQWVQQQVRALRSLGYQVADKDVARVLVELSNAGLFAAGLAVVGTLAYMAWLNELGVKAVAARTQDIDLARRQALKLAAPLSFLDTVQATHLKFFPIPGLSPGSPPTSVKRPGKESLRVDVLTSGPKLGDVVELSELQWHAQTVPHYDYLLNEPRQACLLAGGHCIPVNLPAPERLLWHKLYSSASRTKDPAKSAKDQLQAATLAAVLVERDDAILADSLADAPREVRQAAKRRWPSLKALLRAHPQALEEAERALAAR